MSYTQLSLLAVFIAGGFDYFITKSRLILRKGFWVSYLIIFPFQLLTNWWLTSRDIVIYNSQTIIGWRIASAPAEDLLFGFSLILSVLSLWIYWGRRMR